MMKYVAERIKGLNDADEANVWAEVETIAGELDSCLCRFLAEDLSAEFVDLVMRIRSLRPEATTSGVFNVLLGLSVKSLATDKGVRALLTAGAGDSPKQSKRKSAVRGV